MLGLDAVPDPADSSGIMPNTPNKKKPGPKDANQLAKSIVDRVTGLDEPEPADQPEESAAVKRGRLGGAKGGVSRARKLTAAQRSAIAKKAAAARWKRV